MPELPEVETVARQLAPLVRGQEILAFECLDERLAFVGESLLVGRTIDDVFRVGKQVVLALVRGSSKIWLCVHLRMTGRLVVVRGGAAIEERHLRARMQLDGARLVFHDPRRFGTFCVVRALADARGPGLEPLSSRCTAPVLAGLLGTSRQPLKIWLLRQDRLVGLGNIYASEILHAAGLHPLRAAGGLTPTEVRRLHRATRHILRAAIACCGTTFSDFQDARGVSGGFQAFLQVYGRGNEACRRCGGTVERTVLGGRATFACTRCQPLAHHPDQGPRQRSTGAPSDSTKSPSSPQELHVMITRIEVASRADLVDARGDSVRDSIRTFLDLPVARVRTRAIYKIEGDLTLDEAERVRAEVTDPVTQVSSLDRLPSPGSHWVLTVGFRPGVTDNLGRSAQVAVEDLVGRALPPGAGVYTEQEYHLFGPDLDRDGARRIGEELLANLLIETLTVRSGQRWEEEPADLSLPVIRSQTEPKVDTVDLSGDDDELMRISREGTLSLSLEEMETIRDHFAGADVAAARADIGLPPSPTDVEMECLAQTWSEHCKHKIFNAIIHYHDGEKEHVVDSLFDTFIRGTTGLVARKVDWLVSVFHDNAGVIRLDADRNLVFKVETHNSPSALDPYGGAMTGIVGVNRDPFGTGRGAELLFNVWGYCLASPFHDGPIPEGLLHPRRIRDGVHKGVVDGGNQSGIPYGRGWEFFDARYLGKPLVYCGTVGMMPAEVCGHPAHDKDVQPGHRVVMVGGRIGKDGIHGATFSSEELHSDSPVQAVQIGDPITQKRMTDFLLEARDADLYSAITDNGAGGLSSSVGEMATLCGGARIDLARAPLKYAGLDPWEVLLSEAQERMTLAVPPDRLDAFMELAQRREVEATDLGEFIQYPWFVVTLGDRVIAHMDMAFMHDGCPRMELMAVWTPPALEPRPPAEPDDHGIQLRRMLRRLNLCSGEEKARQYDHEVKGLSVVKPYVGVDADTPSDAAVFMAGHGDRAGVVLSEGILPRYSDLDTYHMAAVATDLAVRRSVATGGRVGHIAALDNFCWPDPVQSERTPDGHHKLAQLVRACQGLHEACLAFDLPLISGKDSMKNDSTRGGVKISIPPTLLVSTIGTMPDVARAVTVDAKRPGDALFVLGWTRPELGGSEYLAHLTETGVTQDWTSRSVPTVDLALSRRCCEAVTRAMDAGLLRTATALGPGGLALALSRTLFGGNLGALVDLGGVPVDPGWAQRELTPSELLYAESGGRFLLSVAASGRDELETLLAGLPLGLLGHVCGADSRGETRLQVVHPPVGLIVDEDLTELKRAWKETLHGI